VGLYDVLTCCGKSGKIEITEEHVYELDWKKVYEENIHHFKQGEGLGDD
jgi:hypothetical protein